MNRYSDRTRKADVVRGRVTIGSATVSLLPYDKGAEGVVLSLPWERLPWDTTREIRVRLHLRRDGQLEAEQC